MSARKERVQEKLETAVVTQSQIENNEVFVKRYFEDAERYLVVDDGVLWRVDSETLQRKERVGEASELSEYVS